MVLQLRYLLCLLAFREKSLLFKNVAKYKIFPYHVRQRLNDDFVRNWIDILNSSSRALFYNKISFKEEGSPRSSECFNFFVRHLGTFVNASHNWYGTVQMLLGALGKPYPT